MSVTIVPPRTDDKKPVSELKTRTSILFIDDDKKFKIAGILQKMGWPNTKLIKDIKSLDDHNVLTADVLFIDIQGVGRLLQLAEEGLGLALAIKKRHPEKKIVIYSAQEEGKRFHEALAEADYFLPKTAEPIQFEEAILKVLRK
jgi:DNA-binding NarL/FixJ family response regulator